VITASHTFFETICTDDNPENIRKTCQPALFVKQLAWASDPAFDDLCIYNQIFVHAVIQGYTKWGVLVKGLQIFSEKCRRIRRFGESHFVKKKLASAGERRWCLEE
jgi:hypothetical protein